MTSTPDRGITESGRGNPEPSEMVSTIEKIIEVIRPAIQADDGDIFLRDVDEASGVVSVELVGACVTCPVSTATLKDGVERILKKRVDGVTSVQHVGAELVGQEEGTPVMLPGAKVSPFSR